MSQVLVKEEAGNKTFYVYGLGLIGEESVAGYKAYHSDFRGSTVALSDAAGAVAERFQYGPYGELVAGNASVTPFLFNGMYGVMTDGNGLYYMRARFYSAEIKRFLNRDVLLGSVARGQSLNRFAFVSGRPVSFVDPFGLEAEIIIFKPVGKGASSFGHVAFHRHGKILSWGPGGMYESTFAEYMRKNDFREAVGSVLDLTLAEEAILEETIREYTLRYNIFQSNCGEPVERGLEHLGYDMGITLFPVSLGDRLLELGLVKEVNVYPRSSEYPDPKWYQNAPWTNY